MSLINVLATLLCLYSRSKDDYTWQYVHYCVSVTSTCDMILTIKNCKKTGSVN